MLKHKLIMLSLCVALSAPMLAQASYQQNRALEAQISKQLEYGDQADRKVLFGLYKKTAALGSIQGQIGLARAYAFGDGVKQSGKQAVEWLSKAVSQGDVGAIYLMGEFHDPKNEAINGVKPNQREALRWYALAVAKSTEADLSVNKGNVGFGVEALAKAYETGDGVGKDGVQAINFYQMLAKVGGRESALINIGDIYKEGKIVPKDYSKALSSYMAASQYESTYGDEYKIGDMYYNGLGVKQDYAKAYEWYRKSAADGDAEGYIAIGKMFSTGTGVSKDKAVAKDWFIAGCNIGSADACRLSK